MYVHRHIQSFGLGPKFFVLIYRLAMNVRKDQEPLQPEVVYCPPHLFDSFIFQGRKREGSNGEYSSSRSVHEIRHTIVQEFAQFDFCFLVQLAEIIWIESMVDGSYL